MDLELNKTQEIINCEHCEPAPRYLPQYENLINDLHESYRQILSRQTKLDTEIDNIAKGLINLTAVVEKILKEVAYSDEEDDDDYEDSDEMEVISKKPKLSNFHIPELKKNEWIENQGAFPSPIGYKKPNLYRSKK